MHLPGHGNGFVITATMLTPDIVRTFFLTFNDSIMRLNTFPDQDKSVSPTDKDVEKVYDSIAEGFYHLRRQPAVFDTEKYARAWKQGKLLDVGCGVATHSIVFAKYGFDCVGVDISKQQLFWAKKNMEKNGVNFPLVKSDCLKLPFKNNTFDYVISIAVVHHLDSEEKRLKSFREIWRVLKPNGVAFITAWNKTQPRFFFGKQDRYVSWNHRGTIYHRYYHLFTYNEMGNLAKMARFKVLKLFAEDSYRLPFKMFSKNVCALLKKQI